MYFGGGRLEGSGLVPVISCGSAAGPACGYSHKRRGTMMCLADLSLEKVKMTPFSKTGQSQSLLPIPLCHQGKVHLGNTFSMGEMEWTVLVNCACCDNLTVVK